MSTPPDQPRPWGAPRPGAPAPRPPDPQSVRQRLQLFMVSLAGLLVVLQLPLPFRLAGLVLVAVLSVTGVQLLLQMRTLNRMGTSTRGSLWVTIGLGLTSVIMVTLLADVVYYPFTSTLERCLSQANTLTAQNTCQKEQQRRIQELSDRLRERAGMP